jgi:hypothetical protein
MFEVKAARVEDNCRREEVACVVRIVQKCLYSVYVHVRRSQWRQSRMYVGCSGNSRVCTRVSVDTVAYVWGRTT